MIHNMPQQKDFAMSPHQSNLRLRGVSPLQFMLISPKEEMYESLFRMREKAKKLFPKTSKIFRLFDDACLPSAVNDPLMDVKILGQGLTIHDNNILSVSPESIIGFAILMPTNKVGYIALATYPQHIYHNGDLVKIPFGGDAVWSGILETFMAKCNNCRLACDNCISSHELSCELLQEAENIGILEEVKDPTDYWTTRSSQSLVQMSNRLRCGCYSEAS